MDAGPSTAAAKVISTAPFAAGGLTTYFGFTLNELGVIIGICATITTVLINWWYKHQHLKLAMARVPPDAYAEDE